MPLAALLSDPAALGVAVGGLVLILLGAAWHKVSEPNAFLAALAAYRIAPGGIVPALSRLLPAVEVGLALGLLVPATRVPALAGTGALLLLYGGAIALNLLRGRHYIDCGCGGGTHPLSWWLVARNALLATVAFAATSPVQARPFGWLDGVTLGAGILAFYGAYLMADELMRQAARMARVDRPEQTGSPFQ